MADTDENAPEPEFEDSLFRPGLALREISPTDNEVVRSLFIESQAGLMPEDADSATRIALKKYTDSCLMDDLSRASVHYSKPGRRMWLLESKEHDIVAMAAVDSNRDEAPSDTALLRRIVVKPEFRRKGLATLLSRHAEQWAARQGFEQMWLYVSELQPSARDMYSKLDYAEVETSSYGPITVFKLQKPLQSSGTTASPKPQ